MARALNRHGGLTNLRHHSLVAWQRADDVFIKLHTLSIQSFPAFEKFELDEWIPALRFAAAGKINR